LFVILPSLSHTGYRISAAKEEEEAIGKNTQILLLVASLCLSHTDTTTHTHHRHPTIPFMRTKRSRKKETKEQQRKSEKNYLRFILIFTRE